MPDADIIIIGAGAAGLAAAGALKQRGLTAVVLEKDSTVGSVWARRYDRLRLHTVRLFSGLPHYGMPRHYPRYVPKDLFAQYLRDYVAHFHLRVVCDCPVQKVRPAAGGPHQGWSVESGCGTWQARVVVIATGQYGIPVLPPWPGLDGYTGTVVHAGHYKTGRAYAGQRVLVVGTGNSGSEIAADLAEQGAAYVAISIRTPPFLVPRDVNGLPLQVTGMVMSRLPPPLADRLATLTARRVVGDLRPYGIPPATRLPYSNHHVPTIDVGFLKELKAGHIQVRPTLARFTPTGVVYADGRAEAFDAVIAATGFTSGLAGLLAVRGLLDAEGNPRYPSGQPTPAPGLYFVGYTYSLRGHLFEANRAARRLAPAVARYLGRTQ